MIEAANPAEAQPPSLKEDPERLVLRAAPRPVVRFRRGLIIGVAGIVSTSLVAVTWLALEPPSFRATAPEETGEPARKATPEALADAPATYGDVPRLGPPLPGDLGRPILEHQRELEAQQAAPSSDGPAELDRGRAAVETERQRLVAERQAARSSAILVQLDLSGKARSWPAPPDAGEAEPAALEVAAPQPRLAGGRARAGESHEPDAPPSPWTLNAGTIIPASLITGLNSDLPGAVLAQVTENVRDSATGRFILIPQGARLIGSYDKITAFGQRRALLVWQRIAFPDGASVALDNVPAADLSGYSGLEDRVDFHSWRLLKGIALSTLLGIGTELGFGSDEGDLVRAVREATQQNAARAGDQITQRNLDVQPTVTVRPGWPVRAIVHKDLALRPWKG